MKYIRACAEGQWHLRLWSKDRPEEPWTCPFRCKSWRHKGPCGHWKGSQDFQRCLEAIRSRTSWVYSVLTYSHSEWPSQADLYRAGVVHWAKLRKRLTRMYGDMAYIQTWERHKTGWPHVNLCISNEILFADVAREWGYDEAKGNHQKDRGTRTGTALWGGIVEGCGFGWRTWLEPMRSEERMAGYLTKLARELTGAVGKDQVPINAPPHFRRLRASRGLLPKPAKNPDVSGTMVFAQMPLEDGEILDLPDEENNVSTTDNHKESKDDKET